MVVIPSFLVKFGIMVGPLFVVRDLVARFILHKPSTWKWFEEITFKIWFPYYCMMDYIYKFIDSIGGDTNTKFWTIEDAIPWYRLARILCQIKEDFERNRLMASLDLIYPISTIANISDHDRPMLQVTAPSPEYGDIPVIDAKHNLWRECRYAVEYATYVYFLDFLGIPSNLEMKLGPFMPKVTSDDTFDPGYFVAFDELNQRLILCIRGSSTLGDFGTDIDALPTEMIHVKDRSYAVHRGIWLAARRLDARIKDTVIKLFNDLRLSYSRLELVITGHSLGAGVSSLLGVMWYYGLTDDISQLSSIDPENGIKDRFYCYSFASPPVIDEKGRDFLLKNMRNSETGQYVITSVVNQIDIVTRMSIPGLFDASNKIEWIGSDLKNYEIIDSIDKKRCQSNQNFIEMITQYILRNQSKLKRNNSGHGHSGHGRDDDLELIPPDFPSSSSSSKKSKRSSKNNNQQIPLSRSKTINAEREKNNNINFTDEEIDFIAKFCKFQNPEELGLPDRVIKNQEGKKYQTLFPCGLVVWRIPKLPWNDLSEAYSQVACVINSNNMANRILTYLGRMYYDVFGDVDVYGCYKGGKGSCKTYFNQFELYKMDGKNTLSNFYIFRNMVINTGAAVCDHMQGQYSSMFGINLITVFKKSSRSFAKFIPDNNEFFLIRWIKYTIAFILFIGGWLWGMMTGVFR